MEANIFTYSALISACAKGGQLDKAMQVFRECQSAGVEPDAITYGTVIAAREGQAVRRAPACFARCAQKSRQRHHVNPCSARDRAGRADDASRSSR